ncbi:hypothetical protein V6R21_15275 [Limibacter armeniacum]|uniref:putative type IX sorting system protein PorV2 n=1 Tax=Limibacter armeniacum TaxID=466084 RepID=UPI002FE6163F
MRIIIALASLLCLLVNMSSAQVSTPKYANEYLAIGVGARGLAMSNSQVDIVDDATAGYWNPAGLLNIKEKYSASLMHASYFAGIANYDFAGFSTNLDKKSAIGISVIRFAVDDIPDTRYLFDASGNLDYSQVKSFSAADYAFIFSYARRFPALKDIKFGANVKVLHRNVGIFANAWGFGFDLGAQTTLGKWNLGITARDITGTFTAWRFNSATFYDVFSQTDNTIPDNSLEVAVPRLLIGGGRNFPILSSKSKDDVNTPSILSLLVSVGADITFDGKRNTVIKTEFGSIDPHAGLEFQIYDVAFVRGGVGMFQYEKDFDGSESLTFQPNFGLGIKLKGITIDYALTDISDQSAALYSHVFSIKAGFGVSKNITPRYQRNRDLLYY